MAVCLIFKSKGLIKHTTSTIHQHPCLLTSVVFRLLGTDYIICIVQFYFVFFKTVNCVSAMHIMFHYFLWFYNNQCFRLWHGDARSLHVMALVLTPMSSFPVFVGLIYLATGCWPVHPIIMCLTSLLYIISFVICHQILYLYTDISDILSAIIVIERMCI